ncbi:hypothetical protein [Pseudomonas sp. LB3P14]
MDTNDGDEKQTPGDPSQELATVGEINTKDQFVDVGSGSQIVGNLEESEGEVFSLLTLEVGFTLWPGIPVTAELEVEYAWSADGTSFSCNAKRYRVSHFGGNSGNIHLGFSSAEHWLLREITNDDAIQDGYWHPITGGSSVTGNTSEAEIIFLYVYDVSGADDPTNSTRQKLYFIPPPFFAEPGVVPTTFNARGTGRPGAELTVYSFGDVRRGSGSVLTNGDWTVSISLPTGASSFDYYARQKNNALESANSAQVTATLEMASVFIDSPRDNEVVRELRPRVSGRGQRGASIRIYKAGNSTVEYGQTTVQNGGDWIVTLTRDLPESAFVLHALQTYNSVGRWSNQVTITVRVKPLTPLITSPPAGSIQNSSFPLGGTGGDTGAIMGVFLDLDHTQKVGEARVTDNSWSVPVTVKPGRVSLVAIQTSSLGTSEPSSARSFDIPPPALTAVDVTYPSGTSVKFSGAGYTTAIVVIEVVSGPAGTAPPPAQVAGGVWETMVTNWPNGTYGLRAIQQVSDNADGWIDSAPYLFTLVHKLPDPHGVTSTSDYQPTLSGQGVLNASVSFYDADQTTKIAPDAKVDFDDNWSSQVLAEWGPTFKRAVHLRQSLNNQHSDWVVYLVTIAPKAAVIETVEEDGLSPLISGTCWLDAVVELVFSDNTTKHPATVIGTTWSYQRPTPFAEGVSHTVTATQTAAQQTSPPASATFTVFRPMIAPVITEPKEATEVSRDVTVRGKDGMKGATVRLFDVRFTKELGCTTPSEDGQWAIDLKTLAFDLHTVEAMQEIDGRESTRSERHTFTVVLMRPDVTSPLPGRSLTRTAEIEGRGLPEGRVDVFLGNAPEPLLKDVPVDRNGYWRAGVTLPVGTTTIWARQYFDNQISKDGLPIIYRVVPAPPWLETPALGEHAGRRTVVSGFGVKGDTVTVMLGDATSTVLGQTSVEDDGTWSIVVEIDSPGRGIELVVVASLDGFDSDGSPGRPVILGTFRPAIDLPAEGQWADNPVHFAGQGQPGVGQVASWYNPDEVWAPNLSVSGIWQGDATRQLPAGGNWCVFWQTLTDDPGGATLSDKTQSQRFEVDPVPSKLTKGTR